MREPWSQGRTRSYACRFTTGREWKAVQLPHISHDQGPHPRITLAGLLMHGLLRGLQPVKRLGFGVQLQGTGCWSCPCPFVRSRPQARLLAHSPIYYLKAIFILTAYFRILLCSTKCNYIYTEKVIMEGREIQRWGRGSSPPQVLYHEKWKNSMKILKRAGLSAVKDRSGLRP
jgi:hypothetical protein